MQKISQYNINIVNESTDPIIVINPAGGQFRIKKLPQIIYLSTSNLWWSQLGTGQAAVGDYNSADYSTTDYNVF